jgi:serine O-acetyltransferase
MESFIEKTVMQLSNPLSMSGVIHKDSHGTMPSIEILREIVEDLRSVLFPGYFSYSDVTGDSMKYYTGALLDRVYQKLSKQIRRGFCFVCEGEEKHSCEKCLDKSQRIAKELVEKLPEIRALLATDAAAAFDGDPAARSIGETIFCYPSVRAITNQRIAHELFVRDVPIIPRMITELAHSQTGIDIHPGAHIGSHFFIDHGTGVVIGETCIIGSNVRLYQGVTLGAKSFPKDEHGNPIKGMPRHPIVEDDVVIYAGASILGRITVGKGAVIGSNVWVTDNVPAGNKVMER